MASTTKDFYPRKVLIVGNGAVQNGWKPLCHALAVPDGVPSSYYERTRADFPTETLANIAFTHRVHRSNLVRELRKTHHKDLIQIKNSIKHLLLVKRIREEISNSYIDAVEVNAISFRKELSYVYNEIDTELDGVITTNWDELWVRKDVIAKNIVALHGHVSSPNSLILPTEMACDDWVFNEDSSLINALSQIETREDLLHEQLYDAFARGAAANQIEHAHFLAMGWLDKAEEIIVWGLGIHPYDAELAAVLRSVASRSKRGIDPIKRLVLIDIEKEKINLVAHTFGIESNRIEFIQATKS